MRDGNCCISLLMMPALTVADGAEITKCGKAGRRAFFPSRRHERIEGINKRTQPNLSEKYDRPPKIWSASVDFFRRAGIFRQAIED